MTQLNNEGFLGKLKQNLYIIVIIASLASSLATCSTRSKIAKIETINVELSSKVDSLTKVVVTKEHLDQTLKTNLYKSLILEEDIDKGVVSISQIKKEQLENEK